MYLALYSLLRFFIEGIRADSLMAFNIRISQILSLIIFVLSIGIIVQNIIREKQTSKKDE
jgi:phosphatidylglycerol:prolipoprotein diacylglycerol transferase